MRRTLGIGTAVVLGGAVLLGQSVSGLASDGSAAPPPHTRRMGPPPGEGGPAPRMHGMAALNLTDAQKSQHKAIFGAERQAARNVEEQLRQVRSTMMAAAKSGASEANIDLLASQEAPLLGQLEAIHGKAFAKFYATLTEDQKGKYEAMTAHRGPRRVPEGAVR